MGDSGGFLSAGQSFAGEVFASWVHLVSMQRQNSVSALKRVDTGSVRADVPGTVYPSAAAPLQSHLRIISSRRGWFDWQLPLLWHSRDLISVFVWRDFVAVYKQTILGPAWHIIQPLFTTVIFTVVFSRMAGLSTDGTPPFLFYMIGNVAWTYFANCLDNTSKTFVANAQLLGKVYFHRLVIPVSLVISNLVAFGIQFGIFLVILVGTVAFGFKLHVTPWALMTPIFLLILAGYGLSGGILVCALTTKYRDMKHLVTFGVQLLMYLTPVIYPVSSVPERYRWLARLNPLTPVVEGFRLGFLGVGTVTFEQVAYSLLVMVAGLTVGLMLFTRVERTFMDTV
jgi:lipopolysaccharide transport system permease protein